MKEVKTNWLRVILVTLSVILAGWLLFLILSRPEAEAITTIDPQTCGEKVYTKTSDFSDSYVNINFESNDYQIDVSGANGWSVTKVELDVSDDGHSGYWTYATNAVNNFNPSGDEINGARVTVYRACPTPTTTPEPTPEPTPYIDPQCEGDECITPTPEVTQPPVTTESKPEGCVANCTVPVCTDTTPQPVVNPHVYRNGDCALVKYWPTSDKVNIYWKQNSSEGWQYSLFNQPATGNHEVCSLGNMDITFGVQSVSGCAADGVVNASTISEVIDGACSNWTLYR